MVSAIWLLAIGTFSKPGREADFSGTAGRNSVACCGAEKEFGTDAREAVIMLNAQKYIKACAAVALIMWIGVCFYMGWY